MESKKNEEEQNNKTKEKNYNKDKKDISINIEHHSNIHNIKDNKNPDIKNNEKEKITENKTQEKNKTIITNNNNDDKTIIDNKPKTKENSNINDNKNNEIKKNEKLDNPKKEEEKEKENEKEEKKEIPKNIYRKEVPVKDWGCRSLDLYDIVNNKPVGDGAYGTVFKAYYKGPKEYAEKYGIPEVVALKKIKTQDEKEGFPITALREIMIMKRLRHKNILQLLEVVTSKPSEKNNFKQNAYLVFEYMEHDLCSILLNKFSYEKSQIKLILYQLLLGLQYLHNNNVLHRDIKSLNILLNNKGEVKIGDFGLSRIFAENMKRKYTNRVVTIWYRAPELLLGETVYGSAIDIWSLGCVFWEVLTGNCLFYGDNEKSVFLKICQICGNPNEINWPGVSQLPYYKGFMPQKKYDNILEKEYKKYNKIDETTFDLLKKMICLNPKERITIDEAFKHPYFTTHEPKMCEEKDMPRIEEELHYYTYKLKKEQQKQQQQHIAKGEYDKKNKPFLGKKRSHH
jgi:cyclin-dependent kinase 12/13